MAREIAIKEQYLANSDEATQGKVLQALSRDFLLFQLGDYRIEVDEMDYAAVCSLLAAVQRELEQQPT